MPRLLREQPLALGCTVTRRDRGSSVLTVVAKAAYGLRPGDVAAWPDGAEPPQFAADQFRGDAKASSLLTAGDFVPFKPRADVLVSGTCHAPGGQPTDAFEVGLRAGTLTKRLLVRGARSWRRGLLSGWQPGPAEPLTELPLVYENAFGGPDSKSNPAGRGRDKKGPLPALEWPDRQVRSPRDDLEPAGFGPLASSWKGRTPMRGTFDAGWLKHQWPGLPLDFDYGHFNSAPRDQQVEGYLRGDEELELTNMHTEHPVLRASLPGHRLRAWFHTDEAGGADGFTEVEMVLDTLTVDTDEGTVGLVWRGVREVDFHTPERVVHLYAHCEDLAAPPGDEAGHHARYTALLQGPPADAEAAAEATPAVEPPELAAAQAEIEAGLARMEEETQKEIDKHLDEACGVLAKSGAPEALLADLRTKRDPEDFVRAMMAHVGYPGEDPGAFAADLAAHNKQVFAKMGVDASVFDTEIRFELPEAPPEPAAGKHLDRDGFLEHLARTRDCKGVDLSGVDLSGLELDGVQLGGAVLHAADLRGSTLRNCSLRGADLGEARLDGATLESCELDGIQASGLALREATVVGCLLEGADLAAADLTGASVRDSDLRGARLGGATLAGATFAACMLAEADLRDAEADGLTIDGCDATGAVLAGMTAARLIATSSVFAGADLSGVRLAGSDLSGSTLEGARAAGCDLQGARLAEVRAGEGADFAGARLDGADAPRSQWAGSDLAGAVLRGAILTGATFEGARLEDCDLRCASARNAVFRAVRAGGARFCGADLMTTVFERAELAGADFAGCNLYGAEFLDAAADHASYLGANLARTKLAGRERA